MEEAEAVEHAKELSAEGDNLVQINDGDNLVQRNDGSMSPSAKRARFEDEFDVHDHKSQKVLSAKDARFVRQSDAAEKVDVNMKRVAEIVIILAGMGQIRGPRCPTDVENELMAEARNQLAVMWDGLSPREFLLKDQCDALAEDLGLNNLSGGKSSGPPRASISERVRTAMKRLKESRELAANSTSYSSQTQYGGHLTNIQNRNGNDASLKISSDRTPVNQVYGFRSAADVRGLSKTNELPETLETVSSSLSEVEPPSSTFPSALPHEILEANSGGMSGSVQSARAGDQMPVSFPVSSTQHHFASSDKGSQGMKVPDTIEGLSTDKYITVTQLNNKNSRVFIQSESSGYRTKDQVIQHAANSNGPSSILSHHNDIVKDIQNILHRESQRSSQWTLPSVAYMDSSLTCEVCKAAITDTVSLVVCDACEKGVHVKCLHVYNQKGVPQGEWHCPKCLIKCLMLNNGKPLAPKYGRIAGNDNLAKLSNTSRPQSSAKNKMEAIIAGRTIEQKLETTGDSTLAYGAPVTKGSDTQNTILDSKIINADASVPHLPRGTKTRHGEQQPTDSDLIKGINGTTIPAPISDAKKLSMEDHHNAIANLKIPNVDMDIDHFSAAIKISHGEEQTTNPDLIKESHETVIHASTSDAKTAQMEDHSLLSQTEIPNSTVCDETLPISLHNSSTISSDDPEPSKEFPT